MTDTRAARIAAGFDIARALGTPEGRELLDQAGWEDGDRISVDSELGQQLAEIGRDGGGRVHMPDYPTAALTWSSQSSAIRSSTDRQCENR